MSANDIRELENMDRISEEDGGDLYLVNGNMLPLSMSGAYAETQVEEQQSGDDPDKQKSRSPDSDRRERKR